MRLRSTHNIVPHALPAVLLTRLAMMAVMIMMITCTSGCSSVPTPALGDGSARPLDDPERIDVLIFLATDCPIANRLAPEISRLHGELASERIRFWRIYADAADGPERIEAHGRDYGLAFPAVRDLDHELVLRAGATVTPEAAVFAFGERVYLGRIDDRFVDYGAARPAPTERDLHDVLAALSAGDVVEPRITEAVGCFIPELRRQERR